MEGNCPEVCPFVEDYSVFIFIVGGGFHLILSDNRKETGQATICIYPHETVSPERSGAPWWQRSINIRSKGWLT